jgi:hypothetical protein
MSRREETSKIMKEKKTPTPLKPRNTFAGADCAFHSVTLRPHRAKRSSYIS